jgi:hypothetical protein
MFIFTVNISHFFIKIIYMDGVDGKDIAMNFIATRICSGLTPFAMLR